MLFGKRNAKVGQAGLQAGLYSCKMPFDVQAPIWDGGDSKLANEYDKMANDISRIRQS